MRIFLVFIPVLGTCFSAQALDRLPIGSQEEINSHLLTAFSASAVWHVRRHITGSGEVDPIAGTAEPSKWDKLRGGRMLDIVKNGQLDVDFLRQNLIAATTQALTDPDVDLGAHIFQTGIQIRIDADKDRAITQTSQIFQIEIDGNGKVVIPDRAYTFDWSIPHSLIVRESGVANIELFVDHEGNEVSLYHSDTSSFLTVFPDKDIVVISLDAQKLGLPGRFVFTYEEDGMSAEFDLHTGVRIGGTAPVDEVDEGDTVLEPYKLSIAKTSGSTIAQGDGMMITVTGKASTTVLIEYSTDLKNWIPLSSIDIDSNDTDSIGYGFFRDDLAISEGVDPQRFYRVRPDDSGPTSALAGSSPNQGSLENRQ